MLLTLPDLNADPGVWDTAINASLARIDLHDHTADLGVQVPSAGININADLTFAGNAAIQLEAISFAGVASYATGKSLWVDSDDNELYWRTSAGTDVKVTSGTSLNLSLVGGITGDYAAASAALYYDDVAEAYRFLEAAPAPNDWSYVKAGGVDIYEHASGISTYVALRSPAALAATYTLTFPAALPGSTLLQQVSAAGAITWSNTIGGAVTFSAATTFSSGVTFSSTATVGLTAAADQHITVSGTGRFKHGDLIKTMSGICAQATTNWTVNSTVGVTSPGAASAFFCPEFDVGERVKSVSISRAGDGAVDVTFTAYDNNGSSSTSIGTSTVNNVAGAATTTIDLTDTTLTTGHSIILEVAANAASLVIYQVEWTYDRP
jgi:hypothetical protein